MTNPVETKSIQLNRRTAMQSLLAVATASLVACRDSQTENPVTPSVADFKIGDEFLTKSEAGLLSALAGLIIPATDTPGAIEAGVPGTIQDLLSNWGEDDVRTHWRSGLASLSDYFEAAKGGSGFAGLSADVQTPLLITLDEGVYKNNIDLPFYKDLKTTIAKAYYMSEAGATQELIYDPVPGDFKGCIDFSEVGKAWAT